ncbi:argonaute 1, variant 2 [Lathyrus oleraceus]|uniref:Argonaute 1, variant 2 n=1 Tax=Pisum sativum TaxID=3888 RepID=A0A9D5AJX8_PEA|nr:argonaute 1, variant 2 [Pisum sativum]
MVEDEDYRRKAKIALVAIVLLASLAVFASFVAFAYYCYILVAEEGLKVFTFKQLHSATGGFSKSNVVGHGGFGLVYRGVLNDGRKVGIKLMDQAGKQGEGEFKVEVELLSRLHSPYLLALLGYCSDHNHKLLVYEFMENGGLQEHLYPVSNKNSSVTSVNLDWETRLRIALEAAKGLEYLHEHVSLL